MAEFSYINEVQLSCPCYNKAICIHVWNIITIAHYMRPLLKLFYVFLFSLQRLQAKVLKLVDISYGGENGFNQAIELSAEVLSNVKFIQEKKLIGESSYSSI